MRAPITCRKKYTKDDGGGGDAFNFILCMFLYHGLEEFLLKEHLTASQYRAHSQLLEYFLTFAHGLICPILLG
jgi:hypothetical protein